MDNLLPAAFIGKPFSDGGTGPENYDCWGLVRAVSAAAGLRFPQYPHVPADHARAVGAAMVGAVQTGGWIRQLCPATLDVVLMSTAPGLLNHVGIMISPREFLHTTRATGAVITRLTDPRWAHAIRGYYRWQP